MLHFLDFLFEQIVLLVNLISHFFYLVCNRLQIFLSVISFLISFSFPLEELLRNVCIEGPFHDSWGTSLRFGFLVRKLNLLLAGENLLGLLPFGRGGNGLFKGSVFELLGFQPGLILKFLSFLKVFLILLIDLFLFFVFLAFFIQ